MGKEKTRAKKIRFFRCIICSEGIFPSNLNKNANQTEKEINRISPIIKNIVRVVAVFLNGNFILIY